MKAPLLRFAARASLAGFIALGIGCYPAYPPGSAYTSGYPQDSKGYEVPYESTSPPQQPVPPRYGVDPGVVIAGAAAVGLLGYAIGSNHHHHGYYGGYYAPVPYRYGPGYYGPGCYR